MYESELRQYADDILNSDNFQKIKEHIQHGNMTVNEHCINVAKTSLRIRDKLHIKCNKRDLIRGALLHDYFLYDWHFKDLKNPHKLHGFYHPSRALHNAQKEYTLTKRQEDIIKKHLAIMDEYDPNHDIDLLVDEWGTWYDVEPGTNPGFLYQQNTMRDAIVAAASLNIFNKHSDRIAMANIAQVVNVLQAMILTEDTKILKTPTYDVFQMYKEHQDATLVESYVADAANRINEPVISYNDISIPALSESVSVTEQNGQKLLTITLSNTSLTDSLSVELELPIKYSFCGKASVAMLHAEARAYNTFDDPDRVRAFETEEDWNGNLQVVSLPACSVCRICCYVS